MPHTESRGCSRAIILGLSLALCGMLEGQGVALASPLQALIVGGGPSPAHNQVAIENNVRYVLRLLPKEQRTTVLFADGNKNNPTVLFQKEQQAMHTQPGDHGVRVAPPEVVRPALTPPDRAEWILDYLLRKSDEAPRSGAGQLTSDKSEDPATTLQAQSNHAQETIDGQLKVPDLTQLNGASKSENIVATFDQMSTLKPTKQPALLYFTGHGSPTPGNHDNNYYWLWNEGQLTVQELARQVARLPEKQAVVLVMVQCFSGAFANLLFEGGDPKAPQTGRDIVGFFAATKDRVAAGCTPEINEANYRDFTSYFFAALTGLNRLGQKTAPEADFNNDGRVGLDEAFYWAVINDESLDVPVATSDLFLERFSPLPNEDWAKTSYSSLLKWASPAQRAALIGLSKALDLQGEDRLAPLAVKAGEIQQKEQDNDPLHLIQLAQTSYREKSKVLLESLPDLTSTDAAAQAAARQQALAIIREDLKGGELQTLSQLAALYTSSMVPAQEGDEVEEAKILRFVRLAQKIVRDRNLRQGSNSIIKKRYMALLKSEAKTLLPYQGR